MLVGGCVALLAVILALTVGQDPLADRRVSRLVGRPAPVLDLPALGGGRVRSQELAGRAVIVNFWNSWCVPCRQEHPALVAFYRSHAQDPNFSMVGIVRDDTRAEIRDFVQAEGVPYSVAFDPGSQAALDFGTRGQPETYAISPTGMVVASKIGPSSVTDLETMLAAARSRAG